MARQGSGSNVFRYFLARVALAAHPQLFSGLPATVLTGLGARGACGLRSLASDRLPVGRGGGGGGDSSSCDSSTELRWKQ